LRTPPTTILLTPQGQRFSQATALNWSKRSSLVFVCGRYEGFDERVRSFVDEEASLGDFVMTGGEVAAMAMIETVVRLLPGVLGNQHSTTEESFSSARGGGLEYPQYTRPASFRGLGVPEVLTTGDHAKIAEWRREQSRQRTRLRRPDLLDAPGGSSADSASDQLDATTPSESEAT
jgi:tRNA (guanine37-N1)-methyltransferase